MEYGATVWDSYKNSTGITLRSSVLHHFNTKYSQYCRLKKTEYKSQYLCHNEMTKHKSYDKQKREPSYENREDYKKALNIITREARR